MAIQSKSVFPVFMVSLMMLWRTLWRPAAWTTGWTTGGRRTEGWRTATWRTARTTRFRRVRCLLFITLLLQFHHVLRDLPTNVDYGCWSISSSRHELFCKMHDGLRDEFHRQTVTKWIKVINSKSSIQHTADQMKVQTKKERKGKKKKKKKKWQSRRRVE